MGSVTIRGDVSSKDYKIEESASGTLRIRNVQDAVDILTVTSTTVTDGSGVALNSHASRHAYGGADALADSALRFSQLDKIFGSETTTSVAAASTATIAKGIYYARGDTNVSVEYSPDGGTTWITIVTAGSAGLIISDGSNVRFKNANTAAAENGYLLPIE